MPVTFGTSTGYTGSTTSTSFTPPTGCTSLIIGAVTFGATALTCTVGGSAATQIASVGNGGGTGRLVVFQFLAPATGSPLTVAISGGDFPAIGAIISVLDDGNAAPTVVTVADSTANPLVTPSLATAADGGAIGISLLFDGDNPITAYGTGESALVATTAATGNRYITASGKSTDGSATTLSHTRTNGTWQASMVGVSFAPAASGPTIDTQPVADVGLINGDPARRTTVYTVEASSAGTISALTWDVDGSPISDGGIYAISTTGIGTSSVSSTLTITRTDKTGTPFDINADVTDGDGTTSTNIVTDTWYTGPVLSKTSGTTNGSGMDTLTCVSDYPNADGEFTTVTATAGGVTKQVSMHYEAP